MGQPKTPLLTYLSKEAQAAAQCDPELLVRAWQYRVAKGLVEAKDFRRNITSWKLKGPDGTIQYLCRENDSGEEMFDRAVQLRKKSGMSADEAKASANEYPTKGGIHSEVNVVAEIYRRKDTILQVFTERRPCSSCRAFMCANFKKVLYVPFFYYLQPPGTERAWQLERYKTVMLFLLSRYQT